MQHRTNGDFWRDYNALAEHVRTRANKQFNLLKTNPHPGSLHFKKLLESSGQEISAGRVSLRYAALALRQGEE